MGDDVNDLVAMAPAGFSAAPADAQPAVLTRAGLAIHANAGFGAVQEQIESPLSARSPDPS